MREVRRLDCTGPDVLASHASASNFGCEYLLSLLAGGIPSHKTILELEPGRVAVSHDSGTPRMNQNVGQNDGTSWRVCDSQKGVMIPSRSQELTSLYSLLIRRTMILYQCNRDFLT